MFSSLGLFCQIECPHKANCLLPNCLFAHSSISAPVTGDSSTSSNFSRSFSDELAQGETTKSRKRRKTETTTQEGGVSAITGKLQPRAVSEQSASKPLQASASPLGSGLDLSSAEKLPLSSAKKPVSPPPSRRQTGNSSHPLQTQKDGKPVALTSSEKQQKPSQNRAPEKETLNPRLLPIPPASHAFRIVIITKLHEELVRLNIANSQTATELPAAKLLSEQDLIVMALDEEERVARGNRLLYSNIIKNRLMAFKKMKIEDWRKLLRERSSSTAASAREPADRKSKSPPAVETSLNKEEELIVLQRLKASLPGLAKFGYVTTIPTTVELEESQKGLEAARGWEVCDRCKTRFQVFPGRREDGSLTSNSTCSYHWGKPVAPSKNQGEKGHPEKKYTCCNEPVGTLAGCTTADNHVFKAGEVKRMATVLQFENTPPNPDAPTNRAVCLDCEMCYTVHGMELVRMTATAWPSGEEILDVLVRPMGEILDLNSRFSGISAQLLANAPRYHEVSGGEEDGITDASSHLQIVSSPSEARELLFRHISPETPIIGHALENDLAATRIIHPFIVDSALLFPHRFGLPYRNSLKALMSKHLQRDIQMMSDDKLGHDSKEDARAAGELVRWAVGNEWKKLKRKGWKMESGVLYPPKPIRSPTPSGSAIEVKREVTGAIRTHDSEARKRQNEPDEGEIIEGHG